MRDLHALSHQVGHQGHKLSEGEQPVTQHTIQAADDADHPLQLRGAQVVIVVVIAALACSQVVRSLTRSGVGSQKRVPMAELPGPIQIDLNTASESELTLLPGLGNKLVRDLTGYRTRHGEFNDWQEVENVDGMGKVTIEAIRPWSRLGTREPILPAEHSTDPIILTAWND